MMMEQEEISTSSILTKSGAKNVHYGWNIMQNILKLDLHIKKTKILLENADIVFVSVFTKQIDKPILAETETDPIL